MRPVRIGTHVGAGLLLLWSLTACGRGGAREAPTLGFSFEFTDADLTESDGPTSVRIVLHAPASLVAEATVEVVDEGSGTATPAADYAVFGAQTITFPIGARDGDSRTVTLEPLDDGLVDGAKTVKLRLQNPSAGALTGPTQFKATVRDVHRALVAFATPSSMTPSESSGARTVALELDCGPGIRLGAATSVLVSDLRTGSASSGRDYAAFPSQTVIFPANSADGGIRTVQVQVVDDGAFEGDETVVLGLSSPSATGVLGANVAHELTIHDDDLAASATFRASEGPSGTQNPLTYSEVVSLGSQTVGAGPNAGTLVRVANGGAVPMHLGAPRLVGLDPGDFALEIESSSASFTPGAPGSGPAPSTKERGTAAALPEVPAPLTAIAGDDGPGLALRLDERMIAHIGTLERVALVDLPLPDVGLVTVELERRPLPLTPDAKLAVDGQEIAGGVRTLVGDLQLWRGAIAGMPGSRVFLALSGSSARGFLELPELPDRLVHVSTGASGEVRLVREEELAALAPLPKELCSGERLVSSQQRIRKPGDPGAETSALTVSDCTLAVETDYQLFQKFGSSTRLASYVTGLIGAVSDRYFTDVQTAISIAYLGIHTGSNDGWSTQETTGAVSSDLLNEFQSKWAPGWPVQANLAHFLSGASLSGGFAYIDVLCSQVSGFAVSANLSGAIDWQSWSGQPGSFTWDFVVVAHELGHNFGSLHTHDWNQYCPPLDRCFTNCAGLSVCSRGTLMSYCHLCAGGLANIDLQFHPVTAEIMRKRAFASCLDDALLAGGDYIQYRVRFNPRTATGVRNAAIRFAHDAPNVTRPFRVGLSGTAR